MVKTKMIAVSDVSRVPRESKKKKPVWLLIDRVFRNQFDGKNETVSSETAVSRTISSRQIVRK